MIKCGKQMKAIEATLSIFTVDHTVNKSLPRLQITRAKKAEMTETRKLQTFLSQILFQPKMLGPLGVTTILSGHKILQTSADRRMCVVAHCKVVFGRSV